MRNVFLLGLLALTFSVFSTTANAGKVEVCEAIKNDPAYQGLYGLCNAYWNETDEQARADILAAFQAKAGPDGPSMPGLDEAFCPCWDQAYLDATVTEGLIGAICEIDADGTGSDLAVYLDDPKAEGYNPNIQLWLEAGILDYDTGIDGTACLVSAFVFPLPDGEGNFLLLPTDPAQDAKCSELLLGAMQAVNFSDDCGQFPE
jgi:hypothetical protein